MNRLNGMQGSEAQLKVLVDRLAQVKDKGLSDRTERAYLRMLLRARLVAMRATIDGITRSMTEAERDAIHKAAGPAKASKFARNLLVAAANKDDAAVRAIMKEVQSEA